MSAAAEEAPTDGSGGGAQGGRQICMPGGQARRRGGGRGLRRAAGETLGPPNRDPSAGGRGRGARGWTYMRSSRGRRGAIQWPVCIAGRPRRVVSAKCARRGKVRSARSPTKWDFVLLERRIFTTRGSMCKKRHRLMNRKGGPSVGPHQNSEEGRGLSTKRAARAGERLGATCRAARTAPTLLTRWFSFQSKEPRIEPTTQCPTTPVWAQLTTITAPLYVSRSDERRHTGPVSQSRRLSATEVGVHPPNT